MKTSLIISTFNSPVALNASLQSVLRQTVFPHEVLVADDGSTDNTPQVIAEFSDKAPFKVRHVWQPNEGFRLGTIRNKAIAAATGDYIIQIDGDILLHPHFIADHCAAASHRHFACGSRVLLNEALTQKVFDCPDTHVGPFTHGVSNRKNAIRSSFLATMINIMSPARLKYRGCNMAFWRNDLIDINGYDEDFCGWGCEDHDLVARLINNSVTPMQLRHRAICFHLWHPSSKEAESFKRNNELLERTRAEHRIRCNNGLDKYLGTESTGTHHE